MQISLKALLKPTTLGRLRYSDSYILYLITVGPSEQQSEPQEIGPENRVVQIVWTRMVKISQAQTPVGSIQRGVALSKVKTNPDDDDIDDSDSTFDAGFFS